MPDRYGDPLDDEPAELDTPDDLWAAEDRARAIVECQLCDDDGYRNRSHVCDHVDRTETAARGIAKAREVLDAINARRGAL